MGISLYMSQNCQYGVLQILKINENQRPLKTKVVVWECQMWDGESGLHSHSCKADESLFLCLIKLWVG